MSEENEKELKTETLNLEKKIELDKGANPEKYKAAAPEDDSDDFDGLIKKKNELLNEKKREQLRNRQLEEELTNLKSMLRKQEDEKLEEKQEYKTLWENTQREKEETEQRFFKLQDSLVKEKKIKEFNKVLGTQLNKDRYYDFVNFEDIIINEDGSVNKDSVKYAVNLLRENYPEIASRSEFPRVGSQAASNTGINMQTDLSSKDARRNLKAKMLRK